MQSNEEGHKIVSLTLTLKVNHQGHVTNFGLFKISDLDLFGNDTKILSLSCMQPKKGHIKGQLSRSGNKFCFSSRSLTSRKLESTPRSLSVLYIQPEIRKVVIIYIYDLDFEGKPSRSS